MPTSSLMSLLLIRGWKLNDIHSLKYFRNFFSVSTLQQFTVLNNKQVANYDDLILTGLSVDDCASSCIAEEYFQCASFEYDYNAATCVLSHLHPDETPKLIKNQNGVDLYIRKESILL